MNIKTTPPDNACFDEDIAPAVIGFYGSCHAVRLVKRGQNDNHICFEILTEDDGNWFKSTNSASSFWLPELIQCFQAAQDWMEKNAEPNMYEGKQFGWKFKP